MRKVRRTRAEHRPPAAAEHSQLLSTGFDDTIAAMQLVRARLGSLLARLA